MHGPKYELELLKEWSWETVSQDEDWRAEQIALFYFFHYVLMKHSEKVLVVHGCSFSPRGLNTLLVVKATVAGIPQVAYATSRYPTGCVRAFCRLWLEERITWHPDKYAKT